MMYSGSNNFDATVEYLNAGICLIPGLFIGIITIGRMSNDANENHKNDIEYEEAEKKYKEIEAKNQEMRDEHLENYERGIESCEIEQSKIKTLLNDAYAVNIIPSQFRNLYASVYLFDYFNTSQANDIEKAFTLFSLDEIKTRLDTIIENQSEMILSQRLMLAEQQNTKELQQQYATTMKSKIDKLNASNEERNTYLNMIEANTRATAYFALADYLK